MGFNNSDLSRNNHINSNVPIITDAGWVLTKIFSFSKKKVDAIKNYYQREIKIKKKRFVNFAYTLIHLPQL